MTRKALWGFVAGMLAVAGIAAAQSAVIIRDADTATIWLDVYTDGSARGTTPRGILQMGDDGTNIQAISVDTSGRLVCVGAAADGAAAAGNPVLMSGYDGTNAQTLLTDSSGRLVTSGASAAPGFNRLQDGDGTTLADVFADGDARGTPKGLACLVDDGANMQTMAGDTGGRLQVNLTDDTTVLSVAVAGSAAPTNGPMCMGTDGTNARAIRTDTTGYQQVVGTVAVGSAVGTTAPVMVGGTDGTNVQRLRTNTDGQIIAAGDTGALAQEANRALGVAGYDGTTYRRFSTDTGGREQANLVGSDDSTVLGVATAGSAVSTTGLMCMGTDGTNARSVSVDTGGRPQVNISDDTDVALVDSSGNLMSSLGTRIAGEDVSNDRLKVELNARTVSNPAVTTTTVSANGTACTTISGASCTSLYASTDWQSYRTLTITLDNTGANALTDCLIEWSPTNADATREIWDSTTMAGLAAGATKSLSIDGNSRRFLRIEGRSASGTTIDVYITAAQ